LFSSNQENKANKLQIGGILKPNQPKKLVGIGLLKILKTEKPDRFCGLKLKIQILRMKYG
jgi:hypothetical protein